MNLETQAQCYDIFGAPEKAKDVEAIEKKFLSLPQVSCPVVHKFGPGIYMREVFLPKGSIVIGHHHNLEHINIFVKGKITFFKDGEPVDMVAPLSFVGKPGRKIAYIHEDTIWMNVWATNETDIEKLEAQFLTKSETWKNDLKECAKIERLTSSVDKKDFSDFAKQFGWTEEKIRFVSEKTDDITNLPFGNYKIKTGESKIEGTGLFATGDFEADELIAPARIGGKRTIAGRYTNHSAFPNAKMISANSDIFLVATKRISGCQGGRDGEEITVNYREALQLTLAIEGDECRL